MRLFITTLSMFSVIAFGYALAGYGSGFFGGAYRMDYILLGLLMGFAFAGLSLWLWRRHRDEFFISADEGGQPPTGSDRSHVDAPDWTLGRNHNEDGPDQG